MQLSKRLQAVAELVTPGNRVADIGCDHAYTSIYLVKQGISRSVIAMDINQGPVDRAKENVAKYHCKDHIEVRKSDGLKKLAPEEADTIIIAGMGGELTVQILSEGMEAVKSARELILQPQSEVYKVRRFLTGCNFIIIHEIMIREDGKYYVMLKAIPSEAVTDKELYQLAGKEHFHYGRLLLEQRNKVLEEFLLWDMEICTKIMDTLTDGNSESSCRRKKEIEDRMVLLRCGLSYYQ